MTTDVNGGLGLTESLPAPSLARRMSCWIYEGMLLFAVIFMASYLFSSLTQTRHGLQNRLGQQIFIFSVLGFYFSWFWHKGQTLAMKTWHIRALDAQGQALTQSRAFARYVLSWVWFVPPLLLTARRLGATHVAAVDGDELLSGLLLHHDTWFSPPKP